MIDTLLTDTTEWERKSKEWHLFILEDCGSIITADSSHRINQALARLLNVVDGFIGQGLKILILITTNEEIESLHEAVARPGRCAAQIEFGKLSKADSDKWRENHKLQPKGTSVSLAELYAELKGFGGYSPEEKKIGFGA